MSHYFRIPSSDNPPANLMCSICLDNENKDTNPLFDHEGREGEKAHAVHEACMDRWTDSRILNIENPLNPSCPECRSDVNWKNRSVENITSRLPERYLRKIGFIAGTIAACAVLMMISNGMRSYSNSMSSGFPLFDDPLERFLTIYLHKF